jgi:ABC-type Fe3+ transport system substrate-binding protein
MEESKIRERFPESIRPSDMKSAVKTIGMVLAMAAIVVVVGALVFWEGGEKTTGNLVIVSPHQEGIQVEFGRAFADWHRRNYGTSVKIDWIDVGGTTKDEQYVRSNFQERPQGGDFDIFFGGGTDPYLEFVDLGIALPFKLPEPSLSELPKEIGGIPLYDASYHWYGTSLTAFGILYNKAVLKQVGLPIPAAWEDLGDPRYFGMVSLADPRYSGTMRMMFEIILQAYGWEKGFALITRIGGNVPSFVHNSSQSAREVTLGEAACGLAIDFYAWAEIAEGGRDKMGFSIPSGLTVINPDSIAILRGAPHVALAKRFVTFVMSEEGQRLWMLPKGVAGGPKEYGLNRMAVLPTVYEQYKGKTLITGNPFEMRMAMRYDREKGGARKDVIKDLIGAAIVDSHAELRSAYKAIIDNGMPEDSVRMLTRCPLTEEEAMALARGDWDDATVRAKVIAEWLDYSRKKLRRIVEKLS